MGRNAQAEGITATYLYAYIQDGLLPDSLTSRVGNLVSSFLPQQTEDELAVAVDIYFAPRKPPQYHTDVEFSKRTLISQICITKDTTETLCKLLSIDIKLSEGVNFKRESICEEYLDTVQSPLYSSHINVSKTCIKLVGCSEDECEVVARFSAFGFFPKLSMHFCIVIVCNLAGCQSGPRYVSAVECTSFGRPYHISLYKNSKSNSIYVLGIAQKAADSACIFKMAITDFPFREYKPNILELIPSMLSSSQISKVIEKDIQLSSPIKSVSFSRLEESRGFALVLEENGRILTLDIEDLEDDEGESL
jgi:hypothetical protein